MNYIIDTGLIILAIIAAIYIIPTLLGVLLYALLLLVILIIGVAIIAVGGIFLILAGIYSFTSEIFFYFTHKNEKNKIVPIDENKKMEN